MYSVFFSKMDIAMDIIASRLKEIIKEESKVLIFPWAFPVEITSEEFESDYFPIGGRRYNKYLDSLKKINIKEENCIVCNPYKHSSEELKRLINESDVLVFPGGNPEMFFKKVLHDKEIIYDIKHFKGIVIGESAGTELQLKRYFITSTNNFYKYFAFYDGFGLIDDPFYMDVHTMNEENYIKELQYASNNTKKTIYAIYDNGVLLYNRETNELEQFGHIEIINPISE